MTKSHSFPDNLDVYEGPPNRFLVFPLTKEFAYAELDNIRLDHKNAIEYPVFLWEGLLDGVSAMCQKSWPWDFGFKKKYPSQCWPPSDNQKCIREGHSSNNPRRGHV